MMLLHTVAAFVILAVALLVLLADPALRWTRKHRMQRLEGTPCSKRGLPLSRLCSGKRQGSSM